MRNVILENLDPDYEEGMQYGMIGYYVPHRIFPPGYHCDPRQPLPFVSLGAQKNHMALHLMCLYGDGPAAERFKKQWARTGKKLDMGKACIRFRKTDDLALDVIADAIARMPARKYIRRIEAALSASGRAKAKRLSATSSRNRARQKGNLSGRKSPRSRGTGQRGARA